MMKRFFRWLYRRGKEAHINDMTGEVNAIAAVKGPSFPDGMHFHLHDAENGKVLQVFITGQNARNQSVGGFNPHGHQQEQKTWVIPDGENVIEFITRALVEERLK